MTDEIGANNEPTAPELPKADGDGETRSASSGMADPGTSSRAPIRTWRRRADRGSAWLGIGLTAALHVAALLIILIADPPFMRSEIFGSVEGFGCFIGILQFAYMFPAMIIAAVMSKNAILKGLLIGASLTLLLNALCFGVVMMGAH